MVSPGFITFSVISLVKGLSSLIRPPFSEVTVIEATSPLTYEAETRKAPIARRFRKETFFQEVGRAVLLPLTHRF